MARRLFVALSFCVSAAALCSAVALAAIQPKTGLYGGTEDQFHNGEGAGYFNVASGGTKIVAAKDQANIVVPTDFICKTGDISASNQLAVKKIPIKNAAFKYSGTPVGVPGRTITVKGKWKTAAKVVGSTKTTGGGCNHTVKWTMTTPPPPGYGGPERMHLAAAPAP
jgi:hypothetical protein